LSTGKAGGDGPGEQRAFRRSESVKIGFGCQTYVAFEFRRYSP
jgi:hypothetical protein